MAVVQGMEISVRYTLTSGYWECAVVTESYPCTRQPVKLGFNALSASNILFSGGRRLILVILAESVQRTSTKRFLGVVIGNSAVSTMRGNFCAQ